MLRTSPPRGRAASLVLFAAVALIALLAAPASAAGDFTVSASEQVTGRDPLVLTPSGLSEPVDLVVEVTDAHGTTGTWNLPAEVVANDTPLPVDLSVPDDGSAPRNGTVDILVSRPKGKAAEATSIIDRAPPAPVLRAVVRDRRVGLTWDAVAMPDPVTYQLQRIATGQEWTTVQEGESAGGYTDRGLEDGRYRYRVRAAVASADGEDLNWSALDAVQIRISESEPEPEQSPSPEPTEPTEPTEPAGEDEESEPSEAPAKPGPKPAASKDDTGGASKPPRNVAATGDVRAPVAGSGGGGPQLQANATQLEVTAGEPAVDAAPPAPPVVETPEVAAPVPATEEVVATAPPALEPFPAPVPAGGTLAVRATGWSPDPLELLTGVVFLLFAAGVVYEVRRRRLSPAVPVSQAQDGHQ